MTLEKMLYTIAFIFLGVFMVSAVLILTNTLNMWLVGLVSLFTCIIFFASAKVIELENKL